MLLAQHRRLRRNPALRALVQENHLHPAHLVYPVFIEEDLTEPQPIAAMPGLFRWPEDKVGSHLQQAQAAGISSFLLFGVSHRKSPAGEDSLSPNGLLARMVKQARQAVPDAVLITDNCFCEYTDHGHCGVLNAHGHVDNAQTVNNLARQAVVAVAAGADMVAPSAMMDGQVAAIRQALDENGYAHIPVMAYASKFASALYGPFREAAGCQLSGDRKTYQMNPANGREALSEAAADEAQGADILMVKPGLFYLDVVANLRRQTHLPLAVYQVSGEYAMLKLAISQGLLNEERAVLESLMAFRRAGADVIITYFAPQAAGWLAGRP